MKDVDNMEGCINLSKIGPSGKFINFKPCKDTDPSVFPEENNMVFNNFTTDYLSKYHLSEDDRMKALSLMVEYLKKRIQEEARELAMKEEKRLIRVLEDEYRLHYMEQALLRNALKKAKQET